ncbi:MAG: AI-2E family transporter [Thermoanaerobaculia bacterium]
MTDKKLSRYFFIALLLGTAVVFFRMVRIFFVPVLLAAVFATLFYPMYLWFLRVFRGRKTLAAFFCCLALLLLLIVPLYGVADLVTHEAITFYRTAQAHVGDLSQQIQGALGRLRDLPLVRDLRLDQVDWRAALQNAASSAGSFAAAVINQTSRGTIEIVILLFVTLFTMFYFFRDGRELLRRLRFLIPLDREHQKAIGTRFSTVARATVKGTLVIALVQGTLSGLTLWIFGIGSPILWGVVATFLAVLPMIGSWLVLYPAAVYQILTGHLWQGIGILLMTVIVIVNVDNVMRPRLVGQEAGMHDLMVFFSTLGGISMFGPMGFIVGPLVAALFLALLDIYSAEFREHLEGALPALPQLEPPAARTLTPGPSPDPSHPPSPGEGKTL